MLRLLFFLSLPLTAMNISDINQLYPEYHDQLVQLATLYKKEKHKSLLYIEAHKGRLILYDATKDRVSRIKIKKVSFNTLLQTLTEYTKAR